MAGTRRRTHRYQHLKGITLFKNKFILGLLATAALAAPIALASSASAYTPTNGNVVGQYLGTEVPGDGGTNLGGTIKTVDMNVTLDNSGYYHEFDLTYSCGADGTIAFSGVGKQFDNDGEYINGAIDNSNHTFNYTAQYIRSDNFGWAASGTLPSTFTFGDADWLTASWNGWGLQGGFYNVPNCAPAPVVGNHGEYVSGAVKAGFKGTKLAAIAKDVTLVGPYTGPHA